MRSMAKNGKLKAEGPAKKAERLHPDTKKSIWAVALLGAAALFTLAGFRKAGPAGDFLFNLLETLFGWGYFVLPASLTAVAIVFLTSGRQKIVGITFLGAGLMVLSALGLIDIGFPGRGGWLGIPLGALRYPFGNIAAWILDGVMFLIGVLVTINAPLRLVLPSRKKKEEKPEAAGILPAAAPETEKTTAEEEIKETAEPRVKEKPFSILPRLKRAPVQKFKDYVPPPLDLLKSSSEKPTTGDLRANANIIKRTLESFGITVEMGEINIGPKVTRYTLKPAEGVKLSRITALNQDLALALAAHPIRIEAPIPGKSLVGIEVPNKAAAVVRLGSLMAYPEFQTSGPLGFCLGRDVTGEPIFADIHKMPHLLIAGSTGSGKSVAIHSLIVSLLYKNSPATLKMILIDPKRVELTVYENLPHLVAPVITEAKKTIAVFRWAISEMERRYELLQRAGSRDITSYNARLRSDGNGDKQTSDEFLPYLLIIIDELADIMAAYGREVEGYIVRLAQMARATGLHLVLSTQRPSVEVITGLIKANITSRIALQVASQVDSRTILDTAGAEKLLGGGDLLFLSPELSKPKRIQGAYISEEEIHRVADFIRENNPEVAAGAETIGFPNGERDTTPAVGKEEIDIFGSLDEEEDELYDEAVEVVRRAKKASASLLQRRLKIGYARAARLLDLMEERGIIGPGEGAKPREVYLQETED
jgi:S-DNA-T family DNA segregation ATPase FtsK/SpoIIIE